MAPTHHRTRANFIKHVVGLWGTSKFSRLYLCKLNITELVKTSSPGYFRWFRCNRFIRYSEPYSSSYAETVHPLEAILIWFVNAMTRQSGTSSQTSRHAYSKYPHFSYLNPKDIVELPVSQILLYVRLVKVEQWGSPARSNDFLQLTAVTVTYIFLFKPVAYLICYVHTAKLAKKDEMQLGLNNDKKKEGKFLLKTGTETGAHFEDKSH